MSRINAFDALVDDAEDAFIDAPVEKKATEKVIKKKAEAKKKNPKAKKAVEAKKPVEEQKPVRPNKREFDRISGTGRGKELRKGGAGRFGAGNPKDPKTQTIDEEKPAEKVEKPVEKTEEELKKEQEKKEMEAMRTIDEYAAEQRKANKGKKMEHLKVAAANEIAEDKACSKATVALKAKDAEPVEKVEKKAEKKTEKKAEKKAAAPKPKAFVGFKFAEGRQRNTEKATKEQKKPTASDFPAL